MSRPRKTSPLLCPNLRAPSRSLMPYSVTIARAIAVAFSMSLAVPDQSVTAFVVGDRLLLLVGHDAALALGAGHDPVDRFLERRHRDLALAHARSQQGRLVDDVGEVGAGETG